MSDSKVEVLISRTYLPIGIDGLDTWVVVEPGLFDYPVPEGATPTLLGSRCAKCGRTFFPKRALCPDCFDLSDMETKRLSSRGVIYSSTVVRVPSPMGIRHPYAYGYIDITGDNIRVHALFVGSDLASFAPGKEVELVIEPFTVNRQGQNVIGYKFKPIA